MSTAIAAVSCPPSPQAGALSATPSLHGAMQGRPTQGEIEQAIHMNAGVICNNRDPILVAFEEYLIGNMRMSDVKKDEEGVLIFNINQVRTVSLNAIKYIDWRFSSICQRMLIV